MGCDIHLCREVRDKDGKWKALETVYRYDITDKWEGAQKSITGSYSGRDYELFSVLSYGVRGEPDFSIGEDRGLPEDVSAEVQTVSNDWGSDGHSHGYATLGELKALWEESGGKITDHSGREPQLIDVSYFFEGWIKQHLEPWAWDGDDSARIVYWFDN